MDTDCTRVPAGTSSTPALLTRVNSNTPSALVEALRVTFTAQAKVSSQAPLAVFTKKFGSTVPAMNSISHITGVVTSAVITRQKGDQALLLLSLLPWAATSASHA